MIGLQYCSILSDLSWFKHRNELNRMDGLDNEEPFRWGTEDRSYKTGMYHRPCRNKLLIIKLNISLISQPLEQQFVFILKFHSKSQPMLVSPNLLVLLKSYNNNNMQVQNDSSADERKGVSKFLRLDPNILLHSHITKTSNRVKIRRRDNIIGGRRVEISHGVTFSVLIRHHAMKRAAEACIGHDAREIAGVNNESVGVRVHMDPLSLLEDLKTAWFGVKNGEDWSVGVRSQTHGPVRFGTTWVEIQLQSRTHVARTDPLPFLLRNPQHLHHHIC